MHRASRTICCFASEQRTISTVAATRTDGVTVCVVTNASIAANTYCNADRAICLSLTQHFRAELSQSLHVNDASAIIDYNGKA